MKNMKSSSNAYIPPEVLTQIFVLLPAKSLLRVRCVCKSWCSVIDDPDFIDMHFRFYNNNNINSDKLLLSFEGLGYNGTCGCLLTLRNAADALRKTGDIFKCGEAYILHGSCNSLLLISRSRNSLCRGMRLYNPSIRKSLLLPRCPVFPCSKYDATYVLGFVPRSKDFKVIAISFKSVPGTYIREVIRLAVFTLADQRWVVRDHRFNFDRLSKMHMFVPYYFCEGAAHWLGKDNPPFEYINNEGRGRPTHLVSLDVDTESFTFLKLPHDLHEVHTIRHLFLLGESVAFFCMSPVSLKIWVLKQESGKKEWTIWFDGPSSSNGFNMFDHWGPRTRVLYYEGNGGGGLGGSLVYENKSYNIATCRVKTIKSLSRYVEFYTYSESMVLWKGYEVEDMASSPFLLGD